VTGRRRRGSAPAARLEADVADREDLVDHEDLAHGAERDRIREPRAILLE
jgi:hypothetical protein